MKLRRFVAGSLAFIMFNMNLFSYGNSAGEIAGAIGDAINKCTHSWDEGEIINEATCTETGETLYTCEDCGETKTEIIS